MSSGRVDEGRSGVQIPGLGQRVRELRHQRGWSVRALTEEVEAVTGATMTRAEVERVEREQRDPTAAELVWLARTLGVAEGDLRGAPSKRGRVNPAAELLRGVAVDLDGASTKRQRVAALVDALGVVHQQLVHEERGAAGRRGDDGHGED